jgi:hypothetical protein
MKRVLALLPVLLALQVGVSPALAWTWPVDGPVLQPFAFDPDSPYAGGQHRGIDVGAPTGTPVRAPAAGTVSFAGTVPGGGLTLAIRTSDGYSVTLVHLGAIGAARGATVEEATSSARSARRGSRSFRSRTSISASGWRPTSRATSTRCRSCRHEAVLLRQMRRQPWTRPRRRRRPARQKSRRTGHRRLAAEKRQELPARLARARAAEATGA